MLNKKDFQNSERNATRTFKILIKKLFQRLFEFYCRVRKEKHKINHKK